MPQVIIPADVPSLDGSVRAQAYAFIDKLRRDDTIPGLRIKQLKQAADRRVRTGRVNDNWRAVLIRLKGSDDKEPRYIYLGTYKHDVANAYAQNVVFQRNPHNGTTEVIRVDLADAVPRVVESSADLTDVPTAASAPEPAAVPVLQGHGTTFEDLLDLGISPLTAHEAILATDADRLLEVAMAAGSAFQIDALLMLGDGATPDQVRDTYEVGPVEGGTENDTDDDLIKALDKPASRMEFRYLVDDEDVRAAIEEENFARWKVFLHPQQRKAAEARTNGAFRLSGGAGTGKTVVLLHRVRHLQRANPDARIVLTTYNATLADELRKALRTLDRNVRIARQLGDPGIYVNNIDKAAYSLIARPGRFGLDTRAATAALFGGIRNDIVQNTDSKTWGHAIERAGQNLPAPLRNVDFLDQENTYVVLPARIASREQYLVERRTGRGVALGRAHRNAVWDVLECYRAMSADARTTDFEEKAMIAALALDAAAHNGSRRLADHVLVDEAQDLTPARFLLLRALVAPGPDDLFIADDSQQRIYSPRTVLSRYGIRVTGRSRRLQLNYRTTAQNLDYATSILAGHDGVDLEDGTVDDSAMRSVRSGPSPQLVGCRSREEALETAVKIIEEWLDAGVPPESIGVLSKWNNDATWMTKQLAHAGIPAEYVSKDVDQWTGRVASLTMHRSKGMEFRNVLVFGVNAASTRVDDRVPEGDRADALQRERSLLYVATTRARDALAVVWEGERSALLPEPGRATTAAAPNRRADRSSASAAVVNAPGGYTDGDDLARQIHDGVGQVLAHIAMTASAVESDDTCPEVTKERMAYIRSSVMRGRKEMHEVMAVLRSGADGRAPVTFADLHRLLDQFQDEGVRIASSVFLSDSQSASSDLAQACFGVVQESVANALKYAPNLPITITLRGGPESGITLVVHNVLPSDAPPSPDSIGTGSGLKGMAERVERLGGVFSAKAVAGRFTVDARIPWVAAG